MARDRWFQPPRHVLVLFVVVTIAPAAALVWLSWQLLSQDRALESQRLQERLAHAADVIGSALGRRLTDATDQLPNLALPARDALTLTCLPGGLEINRGDALLYYPVVSQTQDPPARVFEAGETLEFQRQDYRGAIVQYRVLARAVDPLVRAGALLRLGRTQRKAGQPEEALATYDALAKLGPATLAGRPADLLARQARLTVLESLGRSADLRQEALALRADLHRGRWRLDRPSYDFHVQDVLRWLESDPLPAADTQAALARAAAVETLWSEWQAIRRGEGNPRGRRTVEAYGRSVLIVWSSAADKMVSLVAGPDYIESQWSDAWQGLGVNVTLVDAAGNVVRGQAVTPGQPQVVRAMADTGLPWMLRVGSADPVADLADLAGRRRLLLAGLALMGIVVVGGGYFTARAVTRELAVARLQSDFVSAVSHEFRTPLTSMRHLTELLDRGVVSEEDRRRQYYAALSHETTRLHRLVESLLNFGRMEAGAATYRLEPIKLPDFIAEVVDDFQREACAGGHRVEVRVQEALPEVGADREALALAVWNLLDNAVKYSPDGTPIAVELERAGDEVAIRVRDQGPGVPAGEQKRIFQKFVRGSTAGVSQSKGTGIGLAMVQHVARAHHGRVHLDSEPGKGSTFTMLLPASGNRGSGIMNQGAPVSEDPGHQGPSPDPRSLIPDP